MTVHETETLIIGGGLMGVWTAFHLRQKNRDVTVIEKGFIGAQASGVNYGNLRIQGRYPGQLPLSLKAQDLWDDFVDLVGEDCEISHNGHLYIAHDEEQLAKLQKYASQSRGHGLEVTMMDRAEILSRWPWFGPDVLAASFSGRDGSANPRLSTPAVARAASRAGAIIHEHEQVIAIEKQSDGFAVETNTGKRLACKYLVNTAGAWANEIAAMFGEKAPMFAAGPPQFVTEAVAPFVIPSVQSVDGRVIFRQVERGNIVVAGYPRGPSDIVLNRAPVPPHKTLATMKRLAEIVPGLAQVHVIRVWSGIEGYIPDMLPVIDHSQTTENLYHAFGFCGHGFQLSPGVGLVLCEMITQGKTDIPIANFSISRFSKPGWAGSEAHQAEFEMPLNQTSGQAT